MPFTRISLLAGKPPAHLAAISRALDRAMVEAFEVPEGDLFQVFQQLRPEELVVDQTYLGGPRSADFVLFDVTTGRQRRADVKAAFYKRLAELLQDAPGIRPEDVMIILSNSRSDDWSFSGGDVWRPTAPASIGLPGQMHIRRDGAGIGRSPQGVASAPFWAETLLESTVDGEINAMRATLDPGTRTNWHTHPRGQLLYVLSGAGEAQREGGPVETVQAGDSVWFAPGEKHWHGAGASSTFSYVSVQAVQDGRMVDWLEPVAR